MLLHCEQIVLIEIALKNSNPLWEEQLNEPNFKLEWDNCSKERMKEIKKIRKEKNKALTLFFKKKVNPFF